MKNYSLTNRSKWLYKKAANICRELNQPEVTAEHLIAAFFFCEESKSIRILSEIGFDYESFRVWIVEDFFQAQEEEVKKNKNPKASKQIVNIFQTAKEFSEECDDGWVSIDHIFIGIISNIECVNVNVVEKMDFEYEEYEERITKYFNNETFAEEPLDQKPESKRNKSSKKSILDRCCTNLTSKCQEEEYKIKGRDQDFEKMQYILNRKTKNNVLIVGDSGVGKTALVEYLAHSIASNSCNILLSGKEVYSLNLNSLVSGTKYRGDFERKMESVIDECKNSNIILYIDEIHTLIGAGDAEGGLDAANILKPYLSNGEIIVIGSTTYEEYRKKIHKDKALSRRFDLINLKAPSAEETLGILKNKKDYFTEYHGVSIDDQILSNIIDFADKYIKDTNFPDKAIDLLDLSCSHCKVQKTHKPKSLLEKEAEVVNVLVEMSCKNKKEQNKALKKLSVSDFKQEYEKWLAKIDSSNTVGKLSMIHVIDALCHKTGIPKDKFSKKNKSKYINLEKEIKKDIVGQDEAVSKITKCLLRYKSGLRDIKKPIGSFLFLGSTGVGKTYLAKTLANKMFIAEDNFIRFDMSEFSEEHSVAKLIGSSPGYVGYDRGGLLIEKICQNPHTLILFDEIEKSHPKVQKVLLQILEEGELTDSIGRKANFNNCVIIVTGNIGSSQLSQKTMLGFKPNISSEDIKAEAFKTLKKYMALELMNRFDEIIFFNDFTEEGMKKIIKKELNCFSEVDSVKINYSPSLVNFIYKNNDKKEFGARQIKRVIQNKVLDPLSVFLLNHSYETSVAVSFSSKSNKVEIKQSKKV
jgi:ATP-dependent Clp protease ATP-binding subunit ClpC